MINITSISIISIQILFFVFFSSSSFPDSTTFSIPIFFPSSPPPTMTQQTVIQKLDNLISQVKALDLSSLGPSDRAKAQQSLIEALATAETPYEHLLRLSGS
ncbi:hypothetical protein CTA1_8558, partial [Colletotrichum tanaceti]